MCKLLIYFSGCCLLLLVAANEFPDVPELPDLTPEEDELANLAEQQQHKINWLPVWQEQEQQSPDHLLVRQVRAVAEAETQAELKPEAAALEEPQLERDGGDCASTETSGLTKLIRDARALLPTERLRNILAHASSDAEVRQLSTLLRSDDFKARLARLRQTKEHQTLQDFGCHRLRLNHAYYIDYVRMFLNLQVTEPPTSPLPARRRGVRGLLLDLRDALPRQQLRELYNRQLAKDTQLANSMRLIRGSEFRRQLRDYRGRREYREVRDALEKAGLPTQQLLQLVANAMGWGNVDMGGETVILSV